MTTAERRISKRVPAEFQVNFIHDGDYLISHSRDISIDGMFLYTEDPPNVDDKTTLSFTILDEGHIEVEAKVVWANNSSVGKDIGMAVQFINLSTDAKKSILTLVNKVAVLPS